MIKAVIFDLWGVLIENDSKVCDGAEEVLVKLKSEGYLLGLSTSIGRERMEEVLVKLELDKYFDVKSAGTDVDYNKPSIDVYTRSQQLLAVEPEECLVIEDTPEYLSGIKAAGMKVAWKKTAGQKSDYEKDADYVVEKFEDILSIIKKS